MTEIASDAPRQKRSFVQSMWFKVGAALLVVAGLIGLISRIDLRRDISRLKVTFLSGSPEGNYHAIVDRLAALAAKGGGKITNVSTAGSGDNIARLADTAKSCQAHYGLVQEGLPWPSSPQLYLLGRLPRSESVFFLGKDADRINDFKQLSKAKIGIGPENSGTARMAHQIFDAPDFQSLDLTLSTHSLAEQLDLAKKGELDLAMFVMDEDSPFIVKAIHDEGLQVAGFPHSDVIARRLPHLRTGRIGAGQYDPVRLLPPADKRVMRVDTLIVGNNCAGRSQTVALVTLLAQVFPDFIRHNHDTPNTSGLPWNPMAQSYYENGSPDWMDEYMPWLVDIMPPGNWVYVITAVSILFNVMGFGHRFRLWRIDANRVKLENELDNYFGPGTTLGDISRMTPTQEHLRPEVLAGLQKTIEDLKLLAARSRRQSLSVLVPMGQEMAYRYQENVIYETIAVLRAFVGRCDELAKRAAA